MSEEITYYERNRETILNKLKNIIMIKITY